jgi:thiosulfate dehydrogenase
MKKLILGILIGICLPFLAGYLFVVSGGMPVDTKAPPLPFEKLIVRKALHAAFKNDLDKQPPFPVSEEHLTAGAKIYRNNCGGCHGIGDHENLMAKGMFPPVPQLFQPEKDVTDDPVGEIYWKIKNGIRLTGMPGYTDILKEQELWEVSLFLKNADKLPDAAKKILAGDSH